MLDNIDYAINNGLTPFISMQNHYSILYREEEREMMPTLKVNFYTSLTLRHRRSLIHVSGYSTLA